MSTKTRKLPLLEVKQWLKTWGLAERSGNEDLPDPPHSFYLGSMSIRALRRLAGVSTRDVAKRKKADRAAGYQRAHQRDRSLGISRYIQWGYPLSTQNSLNPNEHRDLINPGWLPTAILVNLIPSDEIRNRGRKDLMVAERDRVEILRESGQILLSYPQNVDTDENWAVSEGSLEPIEIIDGQHRLFAVDSDADLPGEYEVPVVFFEGLPQGWQAYLFWVINVEPKKINTSLAFDLYPELRNQSWLERGEWIKVYQEHRAQELTETLWRHPLSPWQDRIEIHGARIDGHVSNAAFIRSLMASFVRKWGADTRIGGLFGSLDKHGKSYVLPWKRSQQAAFLIAVWGHVLGAVDKSTAPWVTACKKSAGSYKKIPKAQQNPYSLHPAFAGPYALLATDQGVRAILVLFNALSQVRYSELELDEWVSEAVSDAPDEIDVTVALEEFAGFSRANRFLRSIAAALVDGGFDWRTSSEPNLEEHERKAQAAYRGSSGYSLLQREAIRILASSGQGDVAKAAAEAQDLLGWE